jgi:hypothetical protein
MALDSCVLIKVLSAIRVIRSVSSVCSVGISVITSFVVVISVVADSVVVKSVVSDYQATTGKWNSIVDFFVYLSTIVFIYT